MTPEDTHGFLSSRRWRFALGWSAITDVDKVLLRGSFLAPPLETLGLALDSRRRRETRLLVADPDARLLSMMLSSSASSSSEASTEWSRGERCTAVDM